jgi:predicted nucleic acid-binding protein
MVIVDTTVWIDFFKQRDTVQVHRLSEILHNEEDVFTTGFILQEVLSGIKKKKERDEVSSDFKQFILIMPTLQTHIQAAEIFDGCLKRGLTIRKPVDCLIAALAMEYDLPVLEKDSDFKYISEAFPLKREIQ